MATIIKKEKVLTLRELVDRIGEALTEINGEVSDLRKHAVESHLRITLRSLGYKPRETKVQPATVPELHTQLSAALKAEDDTAEDEVHDHIHQHLKTTLSNLTAEVGLVAAPDLKEIPLPPAGKGSPKPLEAGGPPKDPQTKEDFLVYYAKATKAELGKIQKELAKDDQTRPQIAAALAAVTELLK